MNGVSLRPPIQYSKGATTHSLDSAAKIQPFLEEISVSAQGRLVRCASLLVAYMLNHNMRRKGLRRRFRKMKKVIKKQKTAESYLFKSV